MRQISVSGTAGRLRLVRKISMGYEEVSLRREQVGSVSSCLMLSASRLGEDPTLSWMPIPAASCSA